MVRCCFSSGNRLNWGYNHGASSCAIMCHLQAAPCSSMPHNSFLPWFLFCTWIWDVGRCNGSLFNSLFTTIQSVMPAVLQVSWKGFSPRSQTAGVQFRSSSALLFKPFRIHQKQHSSMASKLLIYGYIMYTHTHIYIYIKIYTLFCLYIYIYICVVYGWRTKLLITCNGHGQSEWSPIGCEGLYFHSMCENTGIGKWVVFYRLWRFSRKFKGSKSTPYFSLLLILLVTHTHTHIYIYIYIYVYIYIHIYIYVYIYIVCVCVCAYVCAYIYINILFYCTLQVIIGN